LKIYSDDPIVPYKKTTSGPRDTKADIEGLLARWGITKAGWEWDLENGKCMLEFRIMELINNISATQWIKVEPPIIWKRKSTKRTGNQEDIIDWKVSLRVLFWWMKTNLEMTYLSQSDKTTMFLPYIQNANGETLAKVLVPKITRQLLDVPSLEDLR
jgi:hypothetical protein